MKPVHNCVARTSPPGRLSNFLVICLRGLSSRIYSGFYSNVYLFLCWLIVELQLGYYRVVDKSLCGGDSTAEVLRAKSPLMLSFSCNASAVERSMELLRNPVQAYRDLLWDAPRPIQWVQGQMVASFISILAMIILPPGLYRKVSPWLVAAWRAIAPACLVATSVRPGLQVMHYDYYGAAANMRHTGAEVYIRRALDEYVEFNMRWYPLLDVAFNCIHPTSIAVEIVYGIFSAVCVLTMGLLLGANLPRGFVLPRQLAKCGLSTLTLLAIERWRQRQVSRGRSGRRSCCSEGGSGSDACAAGFQSSAADSGSGAARSGSGSGSGSLVDSGSCATQITNQRGPPSALMGNEVQGSLRQGAARPGDQDGAGSDGGGEGSGTTGGDAVGTLPTGPDCSGGCSSCGSGDTGACDGGADSKRRGRRRVISAVPPLRFGSAPTDWDEDAATTAAITTTAAAGVDANLDVGLEMVTGELAECSGHGRGRAGTGSGGDRASEGPGAVDVAGLGRSEGGEWPAGEQPGPPAPGEEQPDAVGPDERQQAQRQTPQGLEQQREGRDARGLGAHSQGGQGALRHRLQTDVAPLQVVEAATQRLLRGRGGSDSAAAVAAAGGGRGGAPACQPSEAAWPLQLSPRQRRALGSKLKAAYRMCTTEPHQHYRSPQQLPPPQQQQMQQTPAAVLCRLAPNPLLISTCAAPCGLSESREARTGPPAATASELVPERGPCRYVRGARDWEAKPQGSHVPYTHCTVVYGTRIKIDGMEPEHIAAGFQERISRVVAQAGLQLEAVTVRRGCIELVIEARAIEGFVPEGTLDDPDPAAVGRLARTEGAACGSSAIAAAVPADDAERGGAAAAAAAAAAVAGMASVLTGVADAGSEGGLAAQPDAVAGDCTYGRWGDSVTNPGNGPVRTQSRRSTDDVLDIGALIRALHLPDSCSLESDLAPATDDGFELAICGRGSGGGGSGGGAMAPALPFAAVNPPEVARLRAGAFAVAVSAAAAVAGGFAAGSGESSLASGPLGSVFPRSAITDATWWESTQDSSASSSAAAGATAAAGGGPSASTNQEVAGWRLSDPTAAVGGSAAAPRGAPQGQRPLLCPYVLDVYPRVLQASPSPPLGGNLDPSSLQGAQVAATSTHCGSTSAILVMVISWVPLPVTGSSRSGQELRYAPEEGTSAGMAGRNGTAVAAGPWVDVDAAASEAPGSGAIQAPGGPTPTAEGICVWTCAEAPPAAAAAEVEAAVAEAAAGLGPGAAPSPMPCGGRCTGAGEEAGPARPGAAAATSAAAAEAQTTSALAPATGGAQIMLRSHGDVVAAAFVAPSATAAAAAAAATATAMAAAAAGTFGGHSNPAGPPLHGALQTAGATGVHNMTVSLSPDSGEEDDAVEVSWSLRPGSSGSESTRVAVTAAGAAGPVNDAGSRISGDGQLDTAAAAAAAAAPVTGETGAAAALGSEALYSLDLSPLMGRLRPGTLLVDAQPGPESQAEAARHGASAVPVLVVDDPRVAAELQAALDNWYGTVDELDDMLSDMGALIRMQDDLTALVASVAYGGGAAAAAAADRGITNSTFLHLSALSARAQLLYNHLSSYAEAMNWECTWLWLRARQEAVAVAVAAAVAPAPAAAAAGLSWSQLQQLQQSAITAPLLPLPSGRGGGEGSGGGPWPSVGSKVAAEGPPAAMASAASAAASTVVPTCDPEGPDQTAPRPVSIPKPARDASRDATGADAAAVAVEAADAAGEPEPDTTPGPGRPPAAPAPGPCARLGRVLQYHLGVLMVVCGWRREAPADAAAYAAYTASFAASTMNVMQVMDLIGFLTVMIRAAQHSRSTGAGGSGGGGGGGGGGTWLEPDKACVLVAASTGAVMGALWLVLPRATWRRLSAHTKWPRQVSYSMSKAMVAFMGFPQPPTTLRHELGPSIFVVEGVILPAAVLMSPAESVLMGLVRAPLCARMWLLAKAGYTPLFAMIRALALSAVNVITTVVVHMYIRVSYERRNRVAARRDAKRKESKQE